MGNVRSIMDGGRLDNRRFTEQLEELHGCTNYLSTLIRSQQHALKEGLLFVHDQVIRYQKEVKIQTKSASSRILLSPVNFGSTLQQLLD